MMDAEGRPLTVYVAGSTGMVGSAIVRRLRQKGYPLVGDRIPRFDLRNQEATRQLLGELKPDWVFLAAAHVGGINVNTTYTADFICDNLMIQTNVIPASYEAGGQEAPLPWQLMHLSPTRPAADEGRASRLRLFGTDQ